MPIGYLLPAILVLTCSWLVLAPMNWPRPFRFLWFLSAVVNELPQFAIAFLSFDTALAFSQGDIVSTGGWIAFGVNVAAVLALLAMYYYGFRAAPEMRCALDKGLGRGWTEALDPEVVTGLDGRFSGRSLLGPFFMRWGDVEHVRDIAYGPAGKRQMLDVYHPRQTERPGPVFIHLHGGALRGGKKDFYARPVLYHLANRGWVCVSANYRLQPDAVFDEQVADVRSVVAWVRDNIADYGGDPAFVMLSGGSSGGHLAALVGLEPGAVEAVVALYGQFFYGPADESPITYVNEDAPPFFLLHGDHDNLVPVEGTRRFAEALARISQNPVVYTELPHAEHNFDQFNSVRSLAVADAVEAFGEWALEHSASRMSRQASRVSSV